MGLPTKVSISLAIIVGIGLGTAIFIFGALMAAADMRDEIAGFVAGGAGLLVASIAALIAHLAGGFRDLDDPDL